MEAGYEIYEYSRRGSLRDLREALQEGIRPDQYMAYDGSTALVMAARSGSGDFPPHCSAGPYWPAGGRGSAASNGADLALGASPETRTDDGSTLLSHAVSGGSVDIVQAILGAGVSVDEPTEDGVTPLMLAAHYGLADIVEALCEAGANLNRQADGWGSALDSATGEAVDALERRGGRRTEAGRDQPLAAAAERFHYGCFESGENPHTTPTLAPTQEKKPIVGDCVRLRRPKQGLLLEGDVGTVLADDGSDCLPLKVQAGEGYDYYDYHDLIVCAPPVELPPDTDRATAEGTLRYLSSKLGDKFVPSRLGSTGLSISPVGFGCHRLEDVERHKDALKLSLQLGCNLVDLAPNYTDGTAEKVAGDVLKELFDAKKLRRDEVVVATKVGNVLGQQMKFAAGADNMAVVNENLWHCIAPSWIEQDLSRSLERLQLSCVDCLLLHCPEFETKADGVGMDEVYARLRMAFEYLETEVSRGRIAYYGVSAAFMPLRPTDAEHLVLGKVLEQLPTEHSFRVLQFPLNFAEASLLWVGHTERQPDGRAVDSEAAQSAPTFFELARQHGLATLVNRPLDGIYKESHGVLRFSSLDCDVRSFSELQLDNCDALEEKLTSICKLADAPYHSGEGASGQLAAKTVKVLTSLEAVDCVLLGMRQPEYVIGTLPLAFDRPRIPAETAASAVRAAHNTISMWFATAINEADHGTSKDWRLPVDQKGMMDHRSVGA